MEDRAFQNFLTRQHAEATELAAHSDILKLRPLDGFPAQHYLAEFNCRGLIKHPNGRIGEGNKFHIGIFFSRDFLRRASTPEVLTWLGPPEIYHPNIFGPACAICIGRLEPGTSLVWLLYQIYEIIVYFKYNTSDALNQEASSFARNNQHLFPTDHRPLRRPSSRTLMGTKEMTP